MKRPQAKPPHLVITHGDGRLFLQTLLPRDPQVTLRDGEELYRYGGNTYLPRRNTGPAPECRIEVSPSKPARMDYFLHVLTATEATVDSARQATLEESDLEVRVRIGETTVAFQKNEVGGSVEIAGRRRLFPGRMVAPSDGRATN
jgi:hypothetical protein